eukprot:GFUD01111925.1.p1 GENE.GFUD01111925.1~~GFUD01111925.1.p1  ORF type:complete len:201 (-),score=30.66 GFUD01111925.1:57-584(-)
MDASKLKTYLKCPVCLDVPRSKIFVPCPHTTCEKEIVFKQVEDHIKRVHQDMCRVLKRPKKRINNCVLRNCDRKLYVWEHCKVQFFPQIVKRNGDWYIWVKIKEGPIGASQWKFSVKMENKDTVYRMELSGSVHPVDWKVDQQVESGDCLRMGSKNVKKLQDVEECFKTEFKVFK